MNGAKLDKVDREIWDHRIVSVSRDYERRTIARRPVRFHAPTFRPDRFRLRVRSPRRYSRAKRKKRFSSAICARELSRRESSEGWRSGAIRDCISIYKRRKDSSETGQRFGWEPTTKSHRLSLYSGVALPPSTDALFDGVSATPDVRFIYLFVYLLTG